ncbi:CBU_0592 family membrane protein [Candidatus Deianiraea vastatrix]|uniref:CBU_0592 family membrane protein n=1 Tax=Candidatus Deianiraea vastatrix TaxID=2163644 RepID=UPI0011BEEB44|nr:hypothetical protein [Candidatus Deianiraea vastatrix]
MNIYEYLSLIASIICLFANLYVHKTGNTRIYACLTLITSIMFLISAIGFFNRGAIASEIMWLCVSLYGIVKKRNK